LSTVTYDNYDDFGMLVQWVQGVEPCYGETSLSGQGYVNM